MSESVKGSSRRDGGRGARTRATRRRITDAATELFVAHGYVATTLEQIAEWAGVAVQTVYFHFGNKRTVLKQAADIADIAAVGDDEAVPLLDRPWLHQLRAETDPHRIVELWVANSREIHERIAGIMGVVREAAVVDPDMAKQWAVNAHQRATAFRVLAELIDGRDALQPGLSLDDATDIAFAVLSIEVYLLLTTQRGWTPERWQRWTTSALTTTLLAR